MTRKQFVTRKASLTILSPERPDSSTALPQYTASGLQFENRSGAHLLVNPTAGGAIATRRQRFAHTAFCSVSTASAASPSAPSDSRRGAGKDAAAGPDAAGQHAHGLTQGNPSLERLPVAVKRGDQLLPYVWDGHRITAMNEAALQDSDVTTGRLRNWVMGLQRQLKQAFLPDPRDVTPDYWEWLRWRLSQRFFSSTMQNFSFSALLMATGLGAKKAFAASAAINWLLKDGVSRIVRMSVSTSFGQTFDADLKRMRFVTSLIFTACMAGEFATPFWPHHFVALASVSSVGRAVGLSAFVATQPAFQAALATGGNLADLTSKNQAQHMVMDMMALGVSAGLTWLCRSMPRGGLLLPAIMYPLCATGDLVCIWHELKAVQLRSLNRERAEMVIERWMRRGTVPDAAEISAAESLVLPSDVWSGLLPLRIIPLDRLAPANPAALRNLLREYDSEEYVMHVGGRQAAAVAAAAASAAAADGGNRGGKGDGWRLPWSPAEGGGGGAAQQPEVLVSLSDRASPTDIAKALLHAAYLRKAVLEHFVTPVSEAHHHHHKQLHHHSHQGRQTQQAALEGPAGELGSEQLILHHHNHNQKHQNNHRNLDHNHQREHNRKGGSDSAHERDVANNHHNGQNDGRDQFAGINGLLQRRQELAHHQLGGGGGGAAAGHSHDHQHWDAHHHMLYHHNHYHTHSMDAIGVGAHNGHNGHVGGAPLPVARTASLSLSQGHASSSNNSSNNSSSSSSAGGVASSGGGGGVVAARAGCWGAGESRPSSTAACAPHLALGEAEQAAAATEQQAHANHQQQHRQHKHRHGGPGHGGGAGAQPTGQGPDSSAPEPRWEQLDEAAWGGLIRSSRREAERNLPRLLLEAEQAGWKLKPFMLNTTERVQFVRL